MRNSSQVHGHPCRRARTEGVGHVTHAGNKVRYALAPVGAEARIRLWRCRRNLNRDASRAPGGYPVRSGRQQVHATYGDCFGPSQRKGIPGS